MRKPTPKSSRKPDEVAVVDDDFIPCIRDTFENVVKAFVKAQPMKPHGWKLLKGKKNPPKMEMEID